VADFFLIGVCRAFYKNAIPKKLNKKEAYNAFNISPKDDGSKTKSLIDKEKFWLIFQIISYALKIKNAGNNPEKIDWKQTHHIIIDGRECTRIVEALFNGGWNYPYEDSFYKLTSSNDFPDDEIINELDITTENDNYNEDQ